MKLRFVREQKEEKRPGNWGRCCEGWNGIVDEKQMSLNFGV